MQEHASSSRYSTSAAQSDTSTDSSRGFIVDCSTGLLVLVRSNIFATAVGAYHEF